MTSVPAPGSMPPDAPAPHAVHPSLFLALFIPFGTVSGFLTVALAYQLNAQKGVSATAIAGVIALSYLPHTWKFLWAPLVDTLLTRKRWYTMSALCCGLGMVVAGAFTDRAQVPLAAAGGTAAVQGASHPRCCRDVGGEFPDGRDRARLASRPRRRLVPGRQPGRRWAGRRPRAVARAGRALVGRRRGRRADGGVRCMLPSLALRLRERFEGAREGRQRAHGRTRAWDWPTNARALLAELWGLVRSRAGALAMVICFLPIGSGAAQNLWAVIADDWHADADTVALVNGALGGVVSAVGCLAGGWVCDRMDRKTAYCVFGALQMIAAGAMALSARAPAQFVAWTTIYAFIQGLTYAAFSAIALEAIGRVAAATKYSLIASLSNMPVAWVILVDGHANDRWGTRGMLLTEAVWGVGGIVVFAVLAGATKRRGASRLPRRPASA